MFRFMSTVERSVETIRRVHEKLGTVEFARVSGVPYTTVHDCQKRGFVGPSVETLIKLAAAAEAFEQTQVEAPDQASAA